MLWLLLHMYGIGWRRIMTRGNNDGLNGNEFGDDGTTLCAMVVVVAAYDV